MCACQFSWNHSLVYNQESYSTLGGDATDNQQFLSQVMVKINIFSVILAVVASDLAMVASDLAVVASDLAMVASNVTLSVSCFSE